MQLTKEQIQKIDLYLKDNGIQYWDIRIEMVDHIVSDMEQNAVSNEFKTELNAALKRIGWYGNLHKTNRDAWVSVSTRYRKRFLRNFPSFFRNIRNLSFLILGLMVGILLLEYTSFKVFKWYCLGIFAFPIVFIAHSYYDIYRYKLGRSVSLNYATFYSAITYMIIPTPFTWIKDATEITQVIFLIALLTVHYAAFVSGYKLYTESFVNSKQIKEKLNML